MGIGEVMVRGDAGSGAGDVEKKVKKKVDKQFNRHIMAASTGMRMPPRHRLTRRPH